MAKNPTSGSQNLNIDHDLLDNSWLNLYFPSEFDLSLVYYTVLRFHILVIWAGFSVKDCFFVSGCLLFYLIFFMGLFMLCSFCFCCSVLAFVYFLTWNFSSLLIYRHVFGIRYLIRIKDLILYDCFYWHSVCKICFLYLKFCGGHIQLVIGNWFGKSWRGYLQKPLNLIE